MTLNLHLVNIDLGYLGKVTLEEMLMFSYQHGFTITHDGYTASGIRVHGVSDNREHVTYPRCWNNAIIIKL